MVPRSKKTAKVITLVVIFAAVMSAVKANMDLDQILICLSSVSPEQLANR